MGRDGSRLCGPFGLRGRADVDKSESCQQEANSNTTSKVTDFFVVCDIENRFVVGRDLKVTIY